MRKRSLLAFGGLALCLSLTACTPDGEIDFEKAHEVIDVMESELNKIDKEEVKQNVAEGLSQVADALKAIPAPIEEKVTKVVQEPVQETIVEQVTEEQYVAETFEAKPSLWQRIKQSKLGRAIKTIMSIRIVVDNSNALPEGRGEN